MIPIDRIELNPRVCGGKPVIKGTRVPVSVILEQIAAGETWDTVLAGYPELKKEDIQAALLYARASLDHTEVRAVGTLLVFNWGLPRSFGKWYLFSWGALRFRIAISARTFPH